MSDFSNLSEDDIERIRRGIVYSFPASGDDGIIICVGKYGDMEQQVRMRTQPGADLAIEMSQFLGHAANKLEHWFCHSINQVLGGEAFLGSTEWKIVNGTPVARSPIKEVADTSGVDSRCMGKNCHASAGDAETPHSLECQEQTTYTYSGQPEPEILLCEAAVAQRWAEIEAKAAD